MTSHENDRDRRAHVAASPAAQPDPADAKVADAVRERPELRRQDVIDFVSAVCVSMCRACAFRPGSPERRDPYTWMRLEEHWDEDGGVFYCHESVPGHPQQKLDGQPLWRLCAGWNARAARQQAGGQDG